MSTINETAYKGNQTSLGKGVPYIYWINFGQNLVLKPGESYEVVNKIDGTDYTFHMTLKGLGDANLVSSSLPLSTGNIGLSDYTGIKGYPALVSQNSAEIFKTETWTFNTENMYILDGNGNKVSNYSLIFADAEQTNNFGKSEDILFTVSPGSIELYDTSKYQASTGELDIDYLDSNQVYIHSPKPGYNYSPIFIATAPTNCNVKMSSYSNRQGVAFGVILQQGDINIEKSPNKQTIYDSSKDILFSFKFSALPDINGYTSYVIIDTIPSGLSADLGNIKAYQISKDKIYNPIQLTSKVVNNTITITIPIRNITPGANVVVEFPIKITNQSIVPNEFTNQCVLKVINPIIIKNKVSQSNKVNVNLDLVTPDTKDDETLIKFLYYLYLYYCCCLCNKED
ncbi:CshA/CshB family fibrillar adhesin-related protein [uncultured Clostridium sp.]|uniref:CshA/CshB family fibrillar adhesin-related protein n=2 Tax=uncultured Clostridium sp. TaxID=59620 RepID=UPI002606F6D9|nr:CshA/CshB family fibrillar adhesin-related protein [uncultured Clostridium sp.]